MLKRRIHHDSGKLIINKTKRYVHQKQAVFVALLFLLPLILKKANPPRIVCPNRLLFVLLINTISDDFVSVDVSEVGVTTEVSTYKSIHKMYPPFSQN